MLCCLLRSASFLELSESVSTWLEKGASPLGAVAIVATVRGVVDTRAERSAKKLAKAMGEICKGTGALYISLQVEVPIGVASATSLLEPEGSLRGAQRR